jgi:predicted glycoside hydrolase/deacetylase ChbG (UPF0249 family)
MKYLIVNADDFGASIGINRGILELHHRGILTSTSLMINMSAASDAVDVAATAPELDIGLHVALTNEDATPLVDFSDADRCAAELQAQTERFKAALGRLPTHIDSHHNVHRDPRLTPLFISLAQRYVLPLREHSSVRYFSSFYGQWGGETHPEQISVEKLLTMLASEVGEGITELSCHPGYRDPDFESVYHAEREIELRTLADPRILAFLKQHQIRLIGFRDLAKGCFPLHTPFVRVCNVAQGEHADP